MGGTRDNLLGLNPPSPTADPIDIFGGGDPPGTLGIDDDAPNPIPLAARIIATVTKDWEPALNPRKAPEITVGGTTLEQAGKELDRLREWGEGGGSLRTDPIPFGTSTDLTVNLHG